MITVDKGALPLTQKEKKALDIITSGQTTRYEVGEKMIYVYHFDGTLKAFARGDESMKMELWSHIEETQKKVNKLVEEYENLFC